MGSTQLCGHPNFVLCWSLVVTIQETFALSIDHTLRYLWKSSIGTTRPALIVEGDVMLKAYPFIVQESKDMLLKIGPETFREHLPFYDCLGQPGVYFLQIGRNIEPAFLVLCTHTMDLMFWDKDYLSDWWMRSFLVLVISAFSWLKLAKQNKCFQVLQHRITQ